VAPRRLKAGASCYILLRKPRDVDRDPSRLVLRQHLRLESFGIFAGMSFWQPIAWAMAKTVRFLERVAGRSVRTTREKQSGRQCAQAEDFDLYPGRDCEASDVLFRGSISRLGELAWVEAGSPEQPMGHRESGATDAAIV
jgi:hypothetical protein